MFAVSSGLSGQTCRLQGINTIPISQILRYERHRGALPIHRSRPRDGHSARALYTVRLTAHGRHDRLVSPPKSALVVGQPCSCWWARRHVHSSAARPFMHWLRERATELKREYDEAQEKQRVHLTRKGKRVKQKAEPLPHSVRAAIPEYVKQTLHKITEQNAAMTVEKVLEKIYSDHFPINLDSSTWRDCVRAELNKELQKTGTYGRIRTDSGEVSYYTKVIARRQPSEDHSKRTLRPSIRPLLKLDTQSSSSVFQPNQAKSALPGPMPSLLTPDLRPLPEPRLASKSTSQTSLLPVEQQGTIRGQFYTHLVASAQQARLKKDSASRTIPGDLLQAFADDVLAMSAQSETLDGVLVRRGLALVKELRKSEALSRQLQALYDAHRSVPLTARKVFRARAEASYNDRIREPLKILHQRLADIHHGGLTSKALSPERARAFVWQSILWVRLDALKQRIQALDEELHAIEHNRRAYAFQIDETVGQLNWLHHTLKHGVERLAKRQGGMLEGLRQSIGECRKAQADVFAEFVEDKLISISASAVRKHVAKAQLYNISDELAGGFHDFRGFNYMRRLLETSPAIYSFRMRCPLRNLKDLCHENRRMADDLEAATPTLILSRPSWKRALRIRRVRRLIATIQEGSEEMTGFERVAFCSGLWRPHTRMERNLTSALRPLAVYIEAWYRPVQSGLQDVFNLSKAAGPSSPITPSSVRHLKPFMSKIYGSNVQLRRGFEEIYVELAASCLRQPGLTVDCAYARHKGPLVERERILLGLHGGSTVETETGVPLRPSFQTTSLKSPSLPLELAGSRPGIERAISSISTTRLVGIDAVIRSGLDRWNIPRSWIDTITIVSDHKVTVISPGVRRHGSGDYLEDSYPTLAAFMEDRTIIKVGYNLTQLKQALTYDFEVIPDGFVDLAAASKGDSASHEDIHQHPGISKDNPYSMVSPTGLESLNLLENWVARPYNALRTYCQQFTDALSTHTASPYPEISSPTLGPLVLENGDVFDVGGEIAKTLQRSFGRTLRTRKIVLSELSAAMARDMLAQKRELGQQPSVQCLQCYYLFAYFAEDLGSIRRILGVHRPASNVIEATEKTNLPISEWQKSILIGIAEQEKRFVPETRRERMARRRLESRQEIHQRQAAERAGRHKTSEREAARAGAVDSTYQSMAVDDGVVEQQLAETPWTPLEPLEEEFSPADLEDYLSSRQIANKGETSTVTPRVPARLPLSQSTPSRRVAGRSTDSGLKKIRRVGSSATLSARQVRRVGSSATLGAERVRRVGSPAILAETAQDANSLSSRRFGEKQIKKIRRVGSSRRV